MSLKLKIINSNKKDLDKINKFNHKLLIGILKVIISKYKSN